MYSTDNGAESMSWPDGGTTMFRGEKNTNWEGGYRVPCAIRWPGVIKPGTIINEIGAHEDMLPTLLAAAGDPTVKEDLLEGPQGRRPDLQGPPRRLQPHAGAQGRGEAGRARSSSTGPTTAASRRCATAIGRSTFLRQNAHGLHVWMEPFEVLRAPLLINLRADPFERAEYEGFGYKQWFGEHMFMIAPAAAFVGAMAAELPRVPAAPEAGQLQPRTRDGSGDQSARRWQLAV